MKRMQCEICGSFDLLKADGMFQCQSCGMRYSLEEARSLLVETDEPVPAPSSTVPVPAPAPQVDNSRIEGLLALARSAVESKNYPDAEQKCNEIIALAPGCYEAWQIKARAVDGQITGSADRILEVYNCWIGAYRAMNAEEKAEHAREILAEIRKSYESEIRFRVSLFEADRPDKAKVERAKAVFRSALLQVMQAYKDLELLVPGDDETAREYREVSQELSVTYVDAALRSAVSCWYDTVAYNYYRVGSIRFMANASKIKEWDNTANLGSLYHPTKSTMDTFCDEAKAVLALLKSCEDLFQDKFPDTYKLCVYKNIIYIYSELAKVKYYDPMVETTRNGYGNVVGQREYWEPHDTYGFRGSSGEKARYESLFQAANEHLNVTYRQEHPEEFAAMEAKIQRLQAQTVELGKENGANDEQIGQLEARKTPPSAAIAEELKGKQEALRTQQSQLGLFKGKEKRALQAQIDQLQSQIDAALQDAEKERKALAAELDGQIETRRTRKAEIAKELERIEKELAELKERMEGDQWRMSNEDWDRYTL